MILSRIKVQCNYVQVKNEYSTLKKLDHPNIIKAYDLIFDEESGFVYIILEYFEGKTLDDHILDKGNLSGKNLLFNKSY